MQLSPDALKDWKLVRSKEEMIIWHERYTPWLTKSQIICLEAYYAKELEKLVALEKRMTCPKKQEENTKPATRSSRRNKKRKQKKERKEECVVDEKNNKELLLTEFEKLMLYGD